MVIEGKILKGRYVDSISLMLTAQGLQKMEGCEDIALIMGTSENKAILKDSGMNCEAIALANDTDLVIVIKAKTASLAEQLISEAENTLNQKKKNNTSTSVSSSKNFSSALKRLPDAEFAIISIAGRYAANEARRVLDAGLHCMIFSDNVSIEDELSLKQVGLEKGLLVMGPDCGTAIINGIPLGFANAVRRGNIGIVAASGTGLQEVSSLIHQFGFGISQAIGTGGRDVKDSIGGIMTLESLKWLQSDQDTKVIVIVSKPPSVSVLKKIEQQIALSSKPVVAIFLGDKSPSNGSYFKAKNLTEAAEYAVALAKNQPMASHLLSEKLISEKVGRIDTVKRQRLNPSSLICGLYSGGTLAIETEQLVRSSIDSEKYPSVEFHRFIDLGADEYTVGRLHPMMDFDLRCKRMIQESLQLNNQIMLFDLVIGYGSHLNPLEPLLPTIKTCLENNPNIIFITSITGTDDCPQKRTYLINEFTKNGVLVADSNAQAALIAVSLLK